MDIENDRGWICLHRKFLDWEWYDDPNVMRLFIHLLLIANHQDKKWHGILIKRGQVLTSQLKLANSLNFSRMQIRNQLEKLKTTNNITMFTTASYSIITIINYDSYQKNNQPFNQQTTNNITNEQPTTKHKQQLNKEINNTSIINLSLSSKKINKKITKREREILKNYLLRQKRKPDNLEAYIKTIIKNGDWVEIVEKEQNRIQKKEEMQKKHIEQAEKNIISEEDEEKIAKIRYEIKQTLKSRALG